jgi:hypothetical protein
VQPQPFFFAGAHTPSWQLSVAAQARHWPPNVPQAWSLTVATHWVPSQQPPQVEGLQSSAAPPPPPVADPPPPPPPPVGPASKLGMQTVWPARSVQVKPGSQVPHVLRQTPLEQTFPVRQMPSMPLAEHGWFTSAISLVHAQMLPAPRDRHAGHVPGFTGSQPE